MSPLFRLIIMLPPWSDCLAKVLFFNDLPFALAVLT